jgi:hypothetical protein
MIHFKKDGEFFKLGLNMHRAPGGFVAMWVWFDFEKTETFCARLRLRMHVSPRILWSVERVNLIEGYLQRHELEVVNKEVLDDFNRSQEARMRYDDNYAYINRK